MKWARILPAFILGVTVSVVMSGLVVGCDSSEKSGQPSSEKVNTPVYTNLKIRMKLRVLGRQNRQPVSGARVYLHFGDSNEVEKVLEKGRIIGISNEKGSVRKDVEYRIPVQDVGSKNNPIFILVYHDEYHPEWLKLDYAEIRAKTDENGWFTFSLNNVYIRNKAEPGREKAPQAGGRQ